MSLFRPLGYPIKPRPYIFAKELPAEEANLELMLPVLQLGAVYMIALSWHGIQSDLDVLEKATRLKRKFTPAVKMFAGRSRS